MPFGTASLGCEANNLAREINAAFPAGPIHIVAHSMAGLDARFLLSNNLLGLANAGRVATLSMISTPNLGSPIADLLAGPQPSPLDPRRVSYDILVHLAAELGHPVGALGDLTSGFTDGFNPRNPSVQRVRYYSYAGSGMESFILKPSHVYIDAVGRTDHPDGRLHQRIRLRKPDPHGHGRCEYLRATPGCKQLASVFSGANEVSCLAFDLDP